MSRLRNKGMVPAILRAILMVIVLIFTTAPVRAAEFTGTSDYKNNNLQYIYVDDVAKNFEQSQTYLNRPLGIAGNFHIVAFGDAVLKTDTDGNILAGNLTAEAGFGSKGSKEEVSYANTVKAANSTMGAQGSNPLYVGKNNTVDLVDNGDAFRLQGIKLNSPRVLGKDSDTVTYIDLESLHQNVVEQSKAYENLEGASVDYKADTGNPVITIGDTSGINTMSIPVTDLENTDVAFKVQGFTQEGTGCLVINVDAAGQSSITLPQIEMMAGDVPVGAGEIADFQWGRILLNVYDSTALNGQYSGTIHTNKSVTASILAPAASVTVGASLNGNIIAQNVTVNAETHRMDFLGTQSLEESNTSVHGVQEAESMALQAPPSLEASNSEDMAAGIQSAESRDINKSLSYNKTATVNSWDDRTYTIHLDASSLITETSTVTTPYDIVLVLDVSGSMGDTFQTYQKVSSTSLSYGNAYFIKTASGIYEQVSLRWSDVYYYDTATSSWVQKPASEAELYIRQSGSYTTKMAALRSSAKAFVESVRTKSPDSRIGIVTFSGSANTKVRSESDNKSLLRIGNSGSYTQLNSWIDGLNAGGATNSAAGMSNAKTLLENTAVWENVNQGSGREKMVVFLTDGVPTQHSAFDNGVAQGAITAADSIVANNNASIYSLGVFDSANYHGSIIQGNVNTQATVKMIDDYMKGVASDPGYYMTADSVDSLKSLFDSITVNMGKSINGAMVSDVIDPRFELSEAEKQRLMADGASITTGSDGSTIVTWNNQTIKAQSGTVKGWSKDFVVKAKADYIGGNNIPTNGSQSNISCEVGTAYFPQPTVNVKSTLTVDNAEKTIFFGDDMTLTSDNMTKRLFGQVYKNYAGELDNIGVTWYKDEACTQAVDPESTIRAINGKDRLSDTEVNTTYYLKASYNAGTSTESSTVNTGGNVSGGTTNTVVASNTGKSFVGDIQQGDAAELKGKTYGRFMVHMVPGQIELRKSIDSQYTSIGKQKANQTFVYKVERYKEVTDTRPVETFYETISFDANGTIKSDSRLISGLKKGYYKVSEETPWSAKYTLKSKKLGENAFNQTGADANMTDGLGFFIGQSSEKANANGLYTFMGIEDSKSPKGSSGSWSDNTKYMAYANGTHTVVSFVNQNKNWNWLSDTASAINVFNK